MQKKTTVIRKIDELGRVVLPKDIRKQMNIHQGDFLELSCTNEELNVKKHSNIREIIPITNLLLTSLYELFKIEAILIDNQDIVSYPSMLSKKQLEKKWKEQSFFQEPIILYEKEIGKLIFFSEEEHNRLLFSFLSSFLKKYLEEN